MIEVYEIDEVAASTIRAELIRSVEASRPDRIKEAHDRVMAFGWPDKVEAWDLGLSKHD